MIPLLKLLREKPSIEKPKEEEIKESIKKQIVYDVTKINISFPLMFLEYNKKKYKAIEGNIRWDPKINSLRYFVVEPELDINEILILNKIKKILREKVDIDISKIRSKKAFYYLVVQFEKIKKEERIELTTTQNFKFLYYIYRDFIGLGKIEPLMHDPNIEDISCDGINTPVYI